MESWRQKKEEWLRRRKRMEKEKVKEVKGEVMKEGWQGKGGSSKAERKGKDE